MGGRRHGYDERVVGGTQFEDVAGEVGHLKKNGRGSMTGDVLRKTCDV